MVVEPIVAMLKAFFHICVMMLAIVFVMLGGNTEKVLDSRIYAYFYEEEIEEQTSEVEIDGVTYVVTLGGRELYDIFHIDSWGSSAYRPQVSTIEVEYPDGTLYKGEIEGYRLFSSDILGFRVVGEGAVEMFFNDSLQGEKKTVVLVSRKGEVG